jgi:hypothetical protein
MLRSRTWRRQLLLSTPRSRRRVLLGSPFCVSMGQQPAATVLIIALAEDNDQASALTCTTQADTSAVFAINLWVKEPDTRISIASAEAPATALAIALSEEPTSATTIAPVAEAAPALGIVLVNMTITVPRSHFFEREGYHM